MAKKKIKGESSPERSREDNLSPHGDSWFTPRGKAVPFNDLHAADLQRLLRAAARGTVKLHEDKFYRLRAVAAAKGIAAPSFGERAAHVRDMLALAEKDRTALVALADWIEEHNWTQMADYAYALRWLHHFKKFPFRLESLGVEDDLIDDDAGASYGFFLNATYLPGEDLDSFVHFIKRLEADQDDEEEREEDEAVWLDQVIDGMLCHCLGRRSASAPPPTAVDHLRMAAGVRMAAAGVEHLYAVNASVYESARASSIFLWYANYRRVPGNTVSDLCLEFFFEFESLDEAVAGLAVGLARLRSGLLPAG